MLVSPIAMHQRGDIPAAAWAARLTRYNFLKPVPYTIGNNSLPSNVTREKSDVRLRREKTLILT